MSNVRNTAVIEAASRKQLIQICRRPRAATAADDTTCWCDGVGHHDRGMFDARVKKEDKKEETEDQKSRIPARKERRNWRRDRQS